jgi:hypothetical protein
MASKISAGLGGTRAYAGAFLLAVVLYAATVKWQPWGNRLILFLLVLGAPLAGLWLGGRPTRPATRPTTEPVAWSAAGLSRRPADAIPAPAKAARGRLVGAWAAGIALTVGGCAGWLAVGYGWPRRLVGTGSVFSESRLQERFNRRPQWLGDYQWVADAVRAAGAHRVGLVQGEDTWEYPWWVLLRGVDIEALQTVVPHHDPVVRPRDVDAIVCVSDVSTCGYYVPPGWTLHMRGTVGYALRPR